MAKKLEQAVKLRENPSVAANKNRGLHGDPALSDHSEQSFCAQKDWLQNN
jgi:hypothetical protein